MDTSNPYQKMHSEMNQSNRDMMYGASSPPLYSSSEQQEVTGIAQPTQISVLQQPARHAMNYNPPVGPQSTELNCPQCAARIKTKVRHRANTKTHCMCLLLAWTGCCCCLPYCMDSCRDANHFCPLCGAFVGTYHS